MPAKRVPAGISTRWRDSFRDRYRWSRAANFGGTDESRNRVWLNNSRPIRRSSVSSARMDAVRFVGLTRNNNDNAALLPSPSPYLPTRSIFSFSSFSAALSRQSWLCATIVRSVDQSLPGGRPTTNDTRVRTRYTGHIETEGSDGAQEASSLLPHVLLYSRHSSR